MMNGTPAPKLADLPAIEVVPASAQKLGAVQIDEQHESLVRKVSDFHADYIGETGMLAHNAGDSEGKRGDATGRRWSIGTTFDVAGMEEACFDPETLVMGDFGGLTSCEICYIEPGDLVLARNESTGEQALRKVVACFRHEAAELFKVYYNRADGPAALPILTTESHPFWVEGTGWMHAGMLQPDAKLRTHGGFVLVRAARRAGVKSEVFNIEVENFHSYFVGPAGLLVHNKTNTSALRLKSRPRARTDLVGPAAFLTYKTPDTLTDEGIDNSCWSS